MHNLARGYSSHPNYLQMEEGRVGGEGRGRVRAGWRKRRSAMLPQAFNYPMQKDFNLQLNLSPKNGDYFYTCLILLANLQERYYFMIVFTLLNKFYR